MCLTAFAFNKHSQLRFVRFSRFPAFPKGSGSLFRATAAIGVEVFTAESWISGKKVQC